MDPVTQGLLGANVAQIATNHKLKHRGILLGIIAGMSADLDMIVHFHPDTLAQILWHRHFTHALIFIVIGGLLCAGFFCLFFSTYRQHWKITCLAAILAYATHGILDAFTAYGTLLFWPFSNIRIALDYISVIDPIFTFILMIGVIFSAIKQSTQAAIITFLLCLLYLCFAGFQHHRALQAELTLAKQKQYSVLRARAFPKLGQLFHWRGIYITTKKQIGLTQIHTPLFSGATADSNGYVPLFLKHELPTSIRNNTVLFKRFELFHWFTNGYITRVSKTPLIIADCRYLKGKTANIALWGIVFLPEKNNYKIRWLKNINLHPTHLSAVD